MIKFVLYQNNKELCRFNKFNILTDVIPFKSKIYKNNMYSYYKINYNDIYNKIYNNELNQNQLNHLLSIKSILEQSISNNYESIFILEYDVYFHKKFCKLYDEYKKLIDNNDIIHMGSSQHRWYNYITNDKVIIKKYNNLEYYNNTQSLGTFAIILKKVIFRDYLNFINFVLSEHKYFPSDVILSIISQKYKSIVLYPNLIICDLNNSNILQKNRDNDYIKFKWYLNRYQLNL